MAATPGGAYPAGGVIDPRNSHPCSGPQSCTKAGTGALEGMRTGYRDLYALSSDLVAGPPHDRTDGSSLCRYTAKKNGRSQGDAMRHGRRAKRRWGALLGLLAAALVTNPALSAALYTDTATVTGNTVSTGQVSI